MVISVILLLIGLVLIIKGGDFFVDAAAWMAEKTGIPKMVVGATIVSLATTLPEILVSLIAAAGGSVDMAIGNAVGSVTANIGLIMGIAMLFMPGKIALKDYWMKFLLMLVAAVLVVIGGVNGGVNMPMATILVVLVAVFFADNIRVAIKAHREEKASSRKAAGAKTAKSDTKVVKSRAKVANSSAKSVKLRAKGAARGKLPLRERVWWNILKFVLGAAGIVGGAELLVKSGTDIATALGVSERIISVTLIAVGTSLPELVTTISAIIKKEKALSFGNVLGANIIDLALIMPLCAFVSGKTLPIATTSAMIDLPACLIVAAIAIVPTIFTRKFSRWQGALLVLAYVAYLVVTSLVTVG